MEDHLDCEIEARNCEVFGRLFFHGIRVFIVILTGIAVVAALIILTGVAVVAALIILVDPFPTEVWVGDFKFRVDVFLLADKSRLQQADIARFVGCQNALGIFQLEFATDQCWQNPILNEGETVHRIVTLFCAVVEVMCLDFDDETGPFNIVFNNDATLLSLGVHLLDLALLEFVGFVGLSQPGADIIGVLGFNVVDVNFFAVHERDFFRIGDHDQCSVFLHHLGVARQQLVQHRK